MAFNSGQRHYMLIHTMISQRNGTDITSLKNEKLLGIFIDKKLTFDIHIKTQCPRQNK